jgi:hypothetical protein
MSVRSASPEPCVVGIDDTDMPGIGGTGRLARLLAEELAAVAESGGVTRHQLYEGPGVPKTSRNSSAAIAVETSITPVELLERVAIIVSREAIPGSDPGVAVLTGSPPGAVLRFARSAQSGLVTRADATRLAEDAGIPLRGLDGTEDGVIGALCGAALRADGNDGRFVGLPGIRDVSGHTTVTDLLGRTAISHVVDGATGSLLGGEVIIDVGNWVRPRLLHGRPVVVARRVEGTWVNADARPEQGDHR